MKVLAAMGPTSSDHLEDGGLMTEPIDALPQYGRGAS